MENNNSKIPNKETSHISGRKAGTLGADVPQADLCGYPRQNKRLMDGPDTVWSKVLINEKTFKQQINDWTCGPAVVVMLQRVFGLEVLSDDKAIDLTEANNEVGTIADRMVAVVQYLSEKLEIKHDYGNDNPEILRELLREGYLVLIYFREPEEHGGHYAIVQGINKDAMQLADPYHGRESVLPLEKLDWRTDFIEPFVKGWFVALREKAGVV